jgi:hypothetical protein
VSPLLLPRTGAHAPRSPQPRGQTKPGLVIFSEPPIMTDWGEPVNLGRRKKDKGKQDERNLQLEPLSFFRLPASLPQTGVEATATAAGVPGPLDLERAEPTYRGVSEDPLLRTGRQSVVRTLEYRVPTGSQSPCRYNSRPSLLVFQPARAPVPGTPLSGTPRPTGFTIPWKRVPVDPGKNVSRDAVPEQTAFSWTDFQPRTQPRPASGQDSATVRRPRALTSRFLTI